MKSKELPLGCYKSHNRFTAMIFFKNSYATHRVHLGVYDNVIQASGAYVVARGVVDDVGKRCRRWHVQDAIDVYRATIGLSKVRRKGIC